MSEPDNGLIYGVECRHCGASVEVCSVWYSLDALGCCPECDPQGSFDHSRQEVGMTLNGAVVTPLAPPTPDPRRRRR